MLREKAAGLKQRKVVVKKKILYKDTCNPMLPGLLLNVIIQVDTSFIKLHLWALRMTLVFPGVCDKNFFFVSSFAFLFIYFSVQKVHHYRVCPPT